MLNKETQDSLGKLGIDVSKLVEAVTSEDELGLEVPEAKQFTQDEMTVFGKNRFEEGKGALSEIMAKKYKEEYNIDIEGKDLDTVVGAIKDQGFSEAKPDDKEAQKNFKELQSKYEQVIKEREQDSNKYKSELFMVEQKQKLISSIPKGANLDKNDIVDLYLLRNKIDNQDGSAVIMVDGEIKKDDLLNPVPVESDFSSWLDTSGLIGKQGMGGGDSKGGSSAPKFKSVSEFTQYAKENDIDAMSDEGQAFLNKNKDVNFQYN